MRFKLLVLAIFPAPYRANLISYLEKKFDVDSFYERDNDDNRSSSWFVKNTKILTTKSCEDEFNQKTKNIDNYDGVVLYDYTSKRSMKLIMQCKKKNVPYFVNCDGIIFGKRKNVFKNLVKRILLSKVATCFSSEKFAKQYFLAFGVPSNKIFIHPFSTLDKKDILSGPVSKDKTIFKELVNVKFDNIFLAVGRFMHIKNYHWLINEWPSDNGNLLVLIGGGEEKSNYLSIIKRRNLKNVVLIDYLEKNKLMRYFQNADFFIHPTIYDAWGLVINEAMANGLVVCSSDKCVAALELIEDGVNGFIFNTGEDDLSSLLNKVTGLSESEKKLIVEKSIEKISYFTIENMASVQSDVIISILAERRSINEN